MGSSPLHFFHLHSLPPSPLSSLLLGWITPCASSGPVPLVTSLELASCAVLVAVLGRVPDADDPPHETEGSIPALCPVQSSFGIPTRDDSWLALFSMPLTPGSLAACLSTASAGARLILSSAAAHRAAPIESPFNRPSIFFGHAALCACCLPWPVLRYRHPGQPSLRPHCSKSALRRWVLATLFSINTSPGSRGTISDGLSVPTWMSNALSLPSGDQGVART